MYLFIKEVSDKTPMTIETKFKELRKRAEEVLKKKNFQNDESYYSNIEKLIEELNIRQIELEMQNSELHLVVDKLNSEQKKYRDLYQNAPIAYITLNINGNIIEINDAAASLLKLPIHTIYRTSVFPYLTSVSKIRFTKFFNQVFKSNVIESCEIEFIDSEKNIVNTKLSASAYFDAELQLNLCRCAITDITKEKIYREELQMEKHKLDTIFNNVFEGIIICNSKTGALNYANKSFCQLFNYHFDDVSQLHFTQLHPKEFLSTAMNEFLQVGENVKELQNVPCIRSDGSVFYADVRDSKITLDGTECNLATFTDVTSRKSLEEAKSENELKLRKVFDILDVGISVTDKQGMLIDCNTASEKILGVSKEDHLKRSLRSREWKIIRPDNSPMPSDEFPGIKAVRENQTVKNVIMGVVKGDNQVTWISVNATPVNKKGLGAVISYVDITESLKAGKALLESEQRLNLLINSTSDIVFVLDTQQRHTGIYGDWPQKSGLNPEDFIGKTSREVFGDAADVHEEANARALKGEHVKYEWTSCVNNEIYYYQTSLSPLYNGSEITGLIGVGRDISGLKQYEMQLKELNATKDKLFSIIAHDLRTPFNSLLGFSDLLQTNLHKYDKEKIHFQVKQINHIAKNAFSLLEDLLIWYQSQSKKISFEPVNLSFGVVCSEVISNLKGNADTKKISIELADPENIHVMAELNMLKTILRNLLSNAIKFTANNGKICVSAKSGPKFATISVSDTGTGIAKENIKKIFSLTEQFTRLGTSNEKGTGLGLSLCRDFVMKHGGKIWVESEVGKGSDFKFTIPVSDH